MKKALSLFFFFALFCAVVKPTEYTLTETQLQTLETICQKYKANNQKLTEQLNASRNDSKLLQEQLKNERTLTQSLNESLKKYETSVAQSEAEKVQALLDLEQSKTTIQKQQKWIVILIVIAAILLIGGVLLLVLLIKK